MIPVMRRDEVAVHLRSQAGVSLIEVLMVLVLTSAVVLTIAYGLQVSVTTDGQTNRQQRMSLALSTLTDGLRQLQGDGRYIACDGTNAHRCPNDVQDADGRSANALSYESALKAQVAMPSGTVIDALKGVDWQVSKVEYWQPIAFATQSAGSPPTTSVIASSGGGYGPTFSDTSGSQRITIRVSIGGESLTGSAVQRSGAGS